MEFLTSPLKYCYDHVQTTTIVALLVQTAVELFAYTIHIVKWELSYHLSSIKVYSRQPVWILSIRYQRHNTNTNMYIFHYTKQNL